MTFCKIIISIVFYLAVFCTSIQAQFGSISSIIVSPSQPSESDSITIFVQTTFSSGACMLDNNNVALVGNSLKASAHHCVGMLTVICNYTDTFAIGTLSAGNYSFEMTLSSGAGPIPCSPGIFPDDMDTLTFSVSPISGINEMNIEQLDIYPNPFSDQLKIRSKEPVHIILTDIYGKIVLSAKNRNEWINTQNLMPGIYSFQLIEANETRAGILIKE